MLRLHLFNILTIKTPWAIAALYPLSLLVVKTLLIYTYIHLVLHRN